MFPSIPFQKRKVVLGPYQATKEGIDLRDFWYFNYDILIVLFLKKKIMLLCTNHAGIFKMIKMVSNNLVCKPWFELDFNMHDNVWWLYTLLWFISVHIFVGVLFVLIVFFLIVLNKDWPVDLKCFIFLNVSEIILKLH